MDVIISEETRLKMNIADYPHSNEKHRKEMQKSVNKTDKQEIKVDDLIGTLSRSIYGK